MNRRAASFRWPAFLQRGFSPLLLASWVCATVATTSFAQAPLLQIETIEVRVGGPAQFTFRDSGAATSHQAQFSTVVGAGANWQTDSNAVITALGGGSYRVSIANPPQPRGFYRVLGVGGGGNPVLISFATTTLEATEGGGASARINFSAPFTGTIRYTVEGTATAADYEPLSGELRIENSNSAVIPITLKDNGELGRLKQLTITLQAGAGYALGGGSQSTVEIVENDAEWSGSFVSGHSTLPFVLRITRQGGTAEGVFTSRPFGFFPTNELPANLALSANSFSSLVRQIPLPPEVTLFNLPGVLQLELQAANGAQGQEVSDTFVQGAATLITTIPGRSHLSATNRGSFVLTKHPGRPATNQVQLTQAP